MQIILEGHKIPTHLIRFFEPIKPLAAKNLCMIPARVAFALQADGWYLRSDIIWEKPNCMPESVTDRPTKSHEYVFLLTKSARYYWDAEAIKEPIAETTKSRATSGTWHNMEERPDVGFPGAPNRNKAAINRDVRAKVLAGEELTRNVRTVWTIPTTAYRGAHFATFPPKLAERCILAGCPAQCCPKCGKPWERVVEQTGHVSRRESAHAPNNCATKVDSTGWAPTTRATNVFRPTCKCGLSESVPGIVLDPFVGSGTSVAVALALGRSGVGLDLSAKYLRENAMPRVAATQPGLGLR